MPTARAVLSTAVVNGKIYAIGGSAAVEGVHTNLSTVEEYDPATNKWTKKADMPTPIDTYITASVVNGKIYVIGGDYNSRVEEYNPKTDTWTRKADVPTKRGYYAASVVNEKIYVIGGWRGGQLATIEEYDPATDTWTKKADMPTPRTDLLASAVNGKIYVIGGYVYVGDYAGKYVSTVEEYDPATDTWAKKDDMPAPTSLSGISMVNGKIYVMGGVTDHSRVEKYDPATDTWERKADLPTPRRVLSASAVNGYIYAIGGDSGVGVYSGHQLSTVEAYDTGIGIRVTTISLQEGRITGGESIAIFGKGFPSNAIVTIGRKPLTELKATDTLITGVTPPGTEGEQNVVLTAPSVDFGVSAGKFIYNPLSNIVMKRITPTNGKQAGGDVGSIAGSGFLAGATVTINGAPATDVTVTPTLITFTIPPGAEGTKDVVVTNPDGQKGILRGGYTYNPFPLIEKIEPKYGGPLTGGTPLTITGSNFMQGVVVTIGGEQVQRLDLFSLTELRLRTPPGKAGPKDVRVVNPDGQEAVLKEGFTYNPAPTILSVKPNMGPLEGGTEITIIGTGFLSGADILIGGAEVWARTPSPTKIKAGTPPSTAGVKDVMVINRDGQKATLENAFTYNRAPVITSVTPDNGKLAGGTKITIRGSGFLPGAEVLIGVDIDARAFVEVSSTQVMSSVLITAVTPSGDPGPKDVVVKNPDKQEVKLRGDFTYNPMPKITDISPNNGPVSGGTKIIIRGTGFLQRAKVYIGKRAGTTEVRDDSTIEAVTPANPRGVFDVRVINPDTQVAIKRKGFISVGEMVYNFPNPFRAEQGTTFRYVTNERVESIKVQIFNMRGVPIGVVGRSGSNEVRWDDASVYAGLYVYLMEVKVEGGKVKRFRNMLEVYK
ncbi:MAG: IPT/TIG domain-containing protein [Deltaproteobacteria bacterium]|nr:IPT/TIG domain-containing protein [Deltaproteobacteria bacterium]